VEASSIGLFQNGHFVVKHVYNMPRDIVGRALPSGEVKGIHYAASRKDVVVFDDARNDERLNPELIRTYGVRSLIIAPLIARGTVLGAMTFYRFSSSNGYPGAYIDFIRKLSSSLSLALEDARLFAEVRARQERASFIASALENSSQPFVSSYPNGRLMIFNQAFAELTGYTEEELRSMTGAVDLTPAEWREREARVLEELNRTGEPQLYEKEYIRKDGARVLIEVKVHLMRDGKGNPEYYYAFLTDITERRRMQEEMKHLAHHDALTGLPNRMFFTDILARVLAQSQRHQRKLAILFLDLDRFKNINDMLGHDIGDQLLKEVAERLKKSIRSSDTVSRIGGDEFNILLSEITSVDDAAVIARKILAAFQKSCTIAGHELHVTASIGISIYPDDSEDPGKLLKYADTAMYHAKEHGRNIYQFYNAAINISSSKRMQMENSLRQALERGELIVHYQPRVDIKTKDIVGAEALVRWKHPEMGLLDAAQFIPLAEETGFVASIDEWVLRNVCEQVKVWQDAGLSASVSVNLSARQLQSPQLVARVSRIFNETGVSPEALHFEITESIAMHNIERTAERLKELSAMGVQIYIDDFGTGYSSLNYLKRLPIECLKIDKSFIRDIGDDSDNRTIISAVTAMAHKMRLKVIAEGVETQEQFSFLRFAGCDEVQGFLFSRPLPAENFEELISARLLA
ncbi:MAG TPA: EAL domain-containing protein, partial [Dissulfurispiraceae bacterium]|nr:EAL domain-containing protein [Dissulfurispiraceae bacterium]